jgi:hypothetical protein
MSEVTYQPGIALCSSVHGNISARLLASARDAIDQSAQLSILRLVPHRQADLVYAWGGLHENEQTFVAASVLLGSYHNGGCSVGAKYAS